MKEKDYSDLENKEITYQYPGSHDTVDALVIGVDYNIGITIVKANDHNCELVCMPGPSTPIKDEYWPDVYKTCFYSAVAQIKKGVYNGLISRKIFHAIRNEGDLFTGNAGMLHCPYKQ